MHRLELWGGPECTVNRVGGRFGDQSRLTGHHEREGDLDLIASLGVTSIRYPVLWERISPERPDQYDWAWTDARLNGLRERGIGVIAGLVHHGSGPHYTNMLADSFAPGVAAHARAVAERYPWITDWTPINEPCTTARFSCLYGHWYPHRHDEYAFWLALLNQIDATRLAMREVRRINPAARLIQTDDLGRSYSTPETRDQAEYDNSRRWMSWDLLTGRVTPGHFFWNRLCGMGFEDRLRAIADDPCPPDVIGVNHYLTSDRFLDHRLGRYPAELTGESYIGRYVDTEAVRVLQPPPAGLAGVLREAWDRYGLPLAVTEAHNGCSREDQLRWLAEAWRTVEALRSEGADIRAVTIWALFGSSGWNTLLTAPGVYEPGAFDVSGGAPRATAIAGLMRELAAGREPSHPVLAGEGWWRRDIRLHYRPVANPASMRERVAAAPTIASAKPQLVLIAGAGGMLGGALAAACRHRAIAHVAANRAELDLDDDASIAAALDRVRPWRVIDAAGLGRQGADTTRLARACAARGIATVSVSNDQVFGAEPARTWLEADAAQPTGDIGVHMADAEAAIGALPGIHLIVRAGACFTPFDVRNFAMELAETLTAGGRFAAAADETVSPSYVPDLCNALLDLAIDGECGLWHLTNGKALSWADFARRLAQAIDLDPARIDARPAAMLDRHQPRAALASARGLLMPSLDDAIGRFAYELKLSSRARSRSAA